MSHNRIIYLILSDTHGGYELGLVNPETKIHKQDFEDSGYIHTTEANQFLWGDVYLPGLQKVAEFADGDPIVPLHNGDLAHGLKYLDESIDTRMVTQFVVAVENMKPVMRLPNVKMARFISGTPAHSFGQGSVDEMVAYTLREAFPDKDIQAYHHDLLNINDFPIDCAHAGPNTGKRNWLKGNEARLYLQSLVMDELDMGNTPPKLVLRGHFHEFVKTWYGKKINGKYIESWLIVAPPLCLMGDWARSRLQSAYIVSPGMLALEVINGQLCATVFFGQVVDIRKKETIEL